MIDKSNARYKLYIINKTGVNRYPIPLLWISAKTYYEENSIYADCWDWGSPTLDYSDYDNLLAQLIIEKPTVLGFSVYMWNESFSIRLAKDLKNSLKETIIVFGGPQHNIKYNKDFFKEHPYIDLVIPGDSYGEISMSSILDNVVENQGKLLANKINYAYWPDQQQNVVFNSLTAKKKDFSWPKNPYRAQEKIIKPIIDNIHHEEQCWLVIETSRGCPYRCTFCDWGGGTYTKTVKKPFAHVMDELNWIGENKINAIYITDANFGLFDIDVEYAKHIVEVNKKYQYPKRVVFQPTKAKIKNLSKIYEILADADLISQYQISIQDLDDEVKKNVDRIDFSFEDQVTMFKKLQARKYLPIYIECILGMPGSSIETLKTNIHKISLEKLPFPLGHHWALLPEAPAYDLAYREKFKIVTVKGKTSSGSGGSSPLKKKSNAKVDIGVSVGNIDNFDITSEYVIGTMSYTPQDWVEMNLLQVFTASTQNTKILTLISDYLWQEHKINYGEFFHVISKTLLTDPSIDQKFQQNLLKFNLELNHWLSGNSSDVYCDYSDDFPFTFSPMVYYIFIILTDIDNFFKGVLLGISKIVPIDDKIIDLCHYSKNRLLDITYRPGRIFKTKYSWTTYKKNKILEKIPTTYSLNDTKIFSGGKWFDIDWQSYAGSINYLTHFVYRVCYDFKSSKVSNNISESN